MKNLLIITTLAILLMILFCKKNSTDNETIDDKIRVEVLVTEDGSPVENIFVEITAKVQESVKGIVDDIDVKSYESTDVDKLTTNSYGKAVFSYINKSLPDRGGILIVKVRIMKLNTVLKEDTEQKFVKKGETKKLEYSI